MDTQTHKILLNLERTSALADDLFTTAVCQIALTGKPNMQTYSLLRDADRERLHTQFDRGMAFKDRDASWSLDGAERHLRERVYAESGH